MKFKLSTLYGLTVVLFSYAAATVVDVVKDKKFDELQDLNSPLKDIKLNDAAAEGIKDNTPSLHFLHSDGNQADLSLYKDGTNFKYDVEILESADLKKDIVENEEQFRGAALHMDSNIFSDENIETNSSTDVEKVPYYTMACMLALFIIIALAIYVGLIAWRRRLEERYGARVLLVQRCDDEDFVYRSNHTESLQQVPKVPLNPV